MKNILYQLLTTSSVYLLLGFILSPSTAQAYVDPGSGSVIVTTVLGFIAAVGYTFRKFFYNLKRKVFGKKKSEEDHVYTEDYGRLIEIIHSGNRSDDNPSGLRFIALRHVDKDDSLKDPWGNEYVVIADWNQDGKVMVGSKPMKSRPGLTTGKVAVYSKGPNGKDDEGTGDDVMP